MAKLNIEQIFPERVEHEKIYKFSSENCLGFVAIHSTILGNPMGGTRFWKYKNEQKALEDALIVSEDMTYKFAFADMPIGGAKATLIDNGQNKKKALQDYGKVITEINKQLEKEATRYFITGKDLGLTVEDLEFMSEYGGTKYVVGRANSPEGDPSSETAKYVGKTLSVCTKYKFGSEDLKKFKISIQGLGVVGGNLIERLVEIGATNIVATDTNKAKTDYYKNKFPNIRILASDRANEILKEKCDIFIPCATAKQITKEVLEETKCKVVCGGANEPLANRSLEEFMFENKIVYAPDFCVNAAGAIFVGVEMLSAQRGKAFDHKEAESIAWKIPKKIGDLFSKAERSSVNPAELARTIVRDKLKVA